MTLVQIKKTHRYRGYVIWPEYEDEGYERFDCWEVYKCDCPDACDLECVLCAHLPLETTRTLSEARAYVAALAAEDKLLNFLESL
jgi:hypothetical protein